MSNSDRITSKASIRTMTSRSLDRLHTYFHQQRFDIELGINFSEFAASFKEMVITQPDNEQICAVVSVDLSIVALVMYKNTTHVVVNNVLAPESVLAIDPVMVGQLYIHMVLRLSGVHSKVGRNQNPTEDFISRILEHQTHAYFEEAGDASDAQSLSTALVNPLMRRLELVRMMANVYTMRTLEIYRDVEVNGTTVNVIALDGTLTYVSGHVINDTPREFMNELVQELRASTPKVTNKNAFYKAPSDELHNNVEGLLDVVRQMVQKAAESGDDESQKQKNDCQCPACSARRDLSEAFSDEDEFFKLLENITRH